MNLSNSTKQKHINNYNYYCTINEIRWNRPSYKWDRKIPLIPTRENINKIISASTRKYATIFTILAETGLEGMELAKTHRKQIDAERGIINAEGCKGHNSRSFKLKSSTADLLRIYLQKYKSEYPFPKSKIARARYTCYFLALFSISSMVFWFFIVEKYVIGFKKREF